MAMSKDDLLIKIEFEASEAKKAIEDLTGKVNELSSAQKDLDNQQKTLKASNLSGVESFSKVTAAVGGLVAAYYSVAKPLMASVKEFQNAYDANKKLGDIIARNGEVVATSLSDLSEYAGAISESGKASDDAVVSLLSQAKAIGLNNDEAKRLVSASLDLSAVTGDDLNTAFRALLMTYKGVARGLGEQSVLVENLTETQLRAGKAVELIGQKYAGASNEGLKTFEGQSKRLTVALEELQQAIGGIASEMAGAQGPTTRFGDLIVNITNKLKNNSETIINFGQAILSTLLKISATLSKWALEIGKFILIPVDYIYKFMAAWEQLANKVNGTTTAMFKTISGFFSGIRSFLGDTARDLGKMPEAFDASLFKAPEVKEPTPPSGGPLRGAPKVSEEDLKLLDELKKKYAEAQKASEAMGKSEIEQARLKAVADLNEISLLEEKILKAGLMGSKAQEISGNIRTAIVAGFEAAREAALLKTLEDLEKQNQQIAAQNETFGMNTTERLNKELDLQLELIEAQRQKLILEGKYSEAIGASLDEQSALLKERTAQQVSVAPSATVENAGAAASALTGAASPLGAISGFADIVQGLIDFIPNLLSKIEKIFLTLTELPMKILQGVQGVFSAALKFVADFIPNIVKVIPKLFAAAIDFVAKLPSIFVKLVESLPDLLGGIIDKLPELAKSLVIGIVRAIGPMAKALITYMIKYLPQLTLEFVRLLAVELPMAIVDGILAALRGEKFEIPIDTAVLSDTFKKVGESLTGAASRLFSVSDLTDPVVGPAEKLKALAESVKKAFKDGTDLLTKAWTWFKNNILIPLGKFVSDAFQWVVDHVLTPLAKAVEDAFQWVIDHILTPLASIVEKAFQWVVDKVITPLVDFATTLGEKVKTAFNSLVSIGTDIGNAVKDAIYNGVDGLKDKFKELGAAIKDGLDSALDGLKDKFKELGEALAGPLKSLGGGGGGGGGNVLQQAADKILGRSEGGIIPGNAVVFGDSPRNDVIPAMLSPGEAVIPRSAMQDPAIAETVRGILSNRSLPSFSDGLMPRLASSGGNTEINLGGVVVNTSQSVDADFVRSRLMPTIRSELRRASLDGQTVIYKTGVR